MRFSFLAAPRPALALATLLSLTTLAAPSSAQNTQDLRFMADDQPTKSRSSSRRTGIVRPKVLTPEETAPQATNSAQPQRFPVIETSAVEAANGPTLQPAMTSGSVAVQDPAEVEPTITAEEAATTEETSSPGAGAPLVVEAYELTKVAQTPDELAEVIKLCVEAIRAGVNEETAEYARKLSAWAFNRRGELFAADGDEEQALSDFDKAVQIDPTRWQAMHNRGISYAMQGRFNEALEDFNRTVELKPDYATVYFNRGEVRYELGQFEEAIKNYTKALELKPDDSATLNSRGHAYYRLSEFRHAAADFTAALKADTTNAAAYTNRGDLFADLGYYERALNDYKLAIQHDPQLARAYQSAAWLLATCPDEKFRSPKTAIESAQRAIQLDGTGDHRFLDTLAAAQANAGQFDEARKTINRAMQTAPPEVASLYKTRVDLYARNQPLRAKARELPAVADKGQKPQPEAQPSSFEQPVENKPSSAGNK